MAGLLRSLDKSPVSFCIDVKITWQGKNTGRTLDKIFLWSIFNLKERI